MSLSLGIIGLPNVGKSTLFNLLTKTSQAESSNFPFTTIDPNVGIVKVPDKNLDKLAKIVDPKKITPSFIKFYDIAGLVKGAHKGEGLGNQFLSHISKVTAIIHVVRLFEDDNIKHVDDTIDPESDVEIINTELILKDLQVIEKELDNATKQAKSGEKEWVIAKNALELAQKHLSANKPIRDLELPKDEQKVIKPLGLLTAKPMIYVLNVSEDQLKEDIKLNISPTIKLSVKLEQEISELSPEDKTDFLKEYNITDSGLDRLIKESFDLLGLINFYTAGPEEVRSWEILKGSSAPTAAGKIHTDFAKNFIRAEVISLNDYLDLEGEQAAKDAGKMHLEGKDYIVQDNDVIYFRIGN